MKNLLIIQIFAGMFLFSCGQNSQTPVNTENKQQVVAAPAKDSTGAMETVYACPMHPQITGKAGDKCSICKMDLKPVKK